MIPKITIIRDDHSGCDIFIRPDANVAAEIGLWAKEKLISEFLNSPMSEQIIYSMQLFINAKLSYLVESGHIIYWENSKGWRVLKPLIKWVKDE